jgi:hypothetical protein
VATPWTPYRRLALAVLETAVRDAQGGSIDARRFLAENGLMLDHWCQLLALQPSTLRLAAADPQWPERCAKAKALLALSRIKRDPPAPTRAPSPGL